MAEDYRISLGVDLDTSDLKKKIESLDNKHSIKLGVDLKVNDIRDRISAYNKNTNNAKLKLGISLDTDDLKKQINQLDLGGKGKGKGVAIPVNTASLEESFREVKGIITDIKNSLGSLDNKNPRTLVSSINQIASALEKATDESNGLLASLNALADKDFSFNIGISTKNDPISKNILYGDKVKEIFPQLQQQKNAIINALQQYYRDIYAAELKAQKSGNKRKIGAKSVSDDPLSVISYVTGMDIGSAWALLERTDAPLKTTGKNKDNYRDRINEVNDLINSMIKGAKAQGINLDPIINEFSMSSDELIKSANDIQTGTNEVQDSFEKLKKVMGGGIDADGLGQVLKPLLSDIGEIKRAFESLSSIGTIDGLTASFKELSEVLEKLTSNITVVKNALDNGFSDTTIVNSVSDKIEHESDTTTAAVIQNEKKKQEAYRETDNVINQITGFDNAKEELDKLQFNTRSLDSMIDDFNRLGVTVKEISHTLNKDGSITFNVSGVDKLGNAVKAIKTLDSSGNFKSFSSSISQSLEDSDRFIKQQKQAVSNLTNQINQLNRAANDQNASRPIKDSAHLDALSSKYNEVTSAIQRMEAASSDTFIDEQNNVKKLISEYKSLVSEYKNAENVSSKMKGTDFDSGLNIAKNDLEKFKAQAKDFPQITNTIKELDKAIEGVGDAASLNNFNDQLRVARSELAKVKSETTAINRNEKVGINVSGLESKIADLQRISPEIDKFETEIDGAKVSVQSLLNDLKQVNTQGDFSVVNSKFKAFTDAAKAAGIAVTEVVERVKSVKDIRLDVELGTYDNQISQMDDKFNRLSSASKELHESVEQVHQAYARMELALEGTGDEVADKERLIQAEKEYARALEKTNNLIRIQSRQDKIDNDRLKLNDDINVFQSKIDVWLTKNSAATKQFGAAMLDLKAKAEGVDRVDLNHLEKEFKQLDYAAEKAGLKVQSTFDRVKSKFKEYMAYFSVAEVFMYVEQGLREMFNTVKEIDTAMTGLYRVTDLTASQYDALFNDMISSAKEYGATLNDIINATTDWVRAGFDADTALGLAEVTTMYQHISDLDYDIAAENLITAYNGFKDELNSAFDGDTVGAVNYIADIFNELDNNFAVTSAGLGEALTRSASALDLAGNTIQETAG